VSIGDRLRVLSPNGELRTFLWVAAGAVGLVAYIYVVGWIVNLVRLSAARLPASAGVGALGSRQLLGEGLGSTLLMAAVFAVACAIAYFSSRRRWDVQGQDWHDIVRKGGVAKAANAEHVDEQRRRREGLRARNKAAQASAVAKRSEGLPLGLVHGAAERVRTRNQQRAQQLPTEKPKELESAPLGDFAVRIVAGFNIMVLSALIALAVARFVTGILPIAGWVGGVIGVGVFFGVRWLLTRVSPLVFDSRVHGIVWGLVAVAAVFASAPIGVIVLTSVGVATLGRSLARIKQPQSAGQFVRSPLPWILLTICLLLGLAYSATPPVAFSRVTVTIPGGSRVGGYIARTSAGVYLASCTALADATSTDETLDFVPARNVENVQFGGGSAYFDSGQRPSIATLALRALGVGGSTPTLVSAALRAAQPTCGGGGPPFLSTGYEDPVLGTGVIAGPAPAGGRANEGEAPVQDTAPAAVAALARRYQPTMLVTVADQNWPVSVGAILAERGSSNQPVCLVQQRSPQRVCPPAPSSLAGAGTSSSDYLQLPVRLARNQKPGGQFQAFLRGQYIASGSLRRWLANPGVLDPWRSAQIYFYYRGPVSVTAFPAKARDPDVPSGLIALEYWFYYPFNYFPLVTNASLMNGAPIAGDDENNDLHQGDWEHVDVLLDPRTHAPLWLYLARHSYEGQFIPWNSPQIQLDQGHPLLQAAFGGHPTYLAGCGARPRPVTYDLTSDWLSCGSGRFAFRAATTPLVDMADLTRTPWACWPGYFGEASTKLEVQAANQPENLLDSAKHFVFVAGPRAPLRQAENGGVCSGNPAAAERAAGAGGR
jgi:hypothetical protein